MIVFDLICSDGHRFESWFRNGAAYDTQSEDNAIVCPICGDTGVGKAPMRLHVARSGAVGRADASDGEAPAADRAAPSPPSAPSAPVAAPGPPPQAAETLRALRGLIESTCDDVGRQFAEQARRIHYGESDPRNIYGEATPAEAHALREEGIAVQPLPWMRRRDD